jgi:hypothetical protein
MSFIGGIDEGTRSISSVPFDLDTQFKRWKTGEVDSPFHYGFLKAVVSKASVNDKYTLLEEVELEPDEEPTVEQVTEDSLNYRLEFKFVAQDGIAEHTESVWAIKPDDKKGANKQRMMGEFISHMFDTFLGVGSAGKYLTNSYLLKREKKESFTNFGEYFSAIASIFNTGGKDKQPIFTDVLLRIKLVRKGIGAGVKNQNRIQLALGNSIEKVVEDAVSSILFVNPTDVFLSVELPKATAAAPGLGTPKAIGTPVGGQTKGGWDTDI